MGELDDLLKAMGNQITGYVASTLTGIDGINVAQHSRTSLDPDEASAQMTVLLRLIDEVFVKMGGGELEDALMTTSDNLVLMKFLTGKTHYLDIIVDRKSANLGNVRLLCNVYSEKLARALPR